MAYIVMCRVSGGHTGVRQGVLKSNGRVVRFAARDAAQAQADKLTRDLNTERAMAEFEYWVEEESDEL